MNINFIKKYLETEKMDIIDNNLQVNEDDICSRFMTFDSKNESPIDSSIDIDYENEDLDSLLSYKNISEGPQSSNKTVTFENKKEDFLIDKFISFKPKDENPITTHLDLFMDASENKGFTHAVEDFTYWKWTIWKRKLEQDKYLNKDAKKEKIEKSTKYIERDNIKGTITLKEEFPDCKFIYFDSNRYFWNNNIFIIPNKLIELIENNFWNYLKVFLRYRVFCSYNYSTICKMIKYIADLPTKRVINNEICPNFTLFRNGENIDVEVYYCHLE